MKYLVLALSLPIMLMANAVRADCWLLLENVSVVDYPGHPELGGTITWYYSFECWDYGSPPFYEPPDRGGPYTPPDQPPDLWISTISDANPRESRHDHGRPQSGVD